MVKDEAIKAIEGMDNDASIGDIMYRLYVLDKHRKALDDIENGRVFTTQNIKETIGTRQ